MSLKPESMGVIHEMTFVKDVLAGLGANTSRIQAKEMGQTVSVSDNSIPEGNRRAEFVKI